MICARVAHRRLRLSAEQLKQLFNRRSAAAVKKAIKPFSNLILGEGIWDHFDDLDEATLQATPPATRPLLKADEGIRSPPPLRWPTGGSLRRATKSFLSISNAWALTRPSWTPF